MDFGSIFNKAQESLKHLEQDFTKELGLSSQQREDEPEESWDNWGGEEDEWVDVNASQDVGNGMMQDGAPPSEGIYSISHEQYPTVYEDGAAEDAQEEFTGLSIADSTGVSEPVVAEAPLDKVETFEEGDESQEHVENGTNEPEVMTAPEGPPPPKPDDDDRSQLLSSLEEAKWKNAELEALLKMTTANLQASDRKVRAISKECDSLRRARDNRASDAMLLKEKDKQIQAVMSEGEQLSRKIAEREGKLRAVIAEKADLVDTHKTLQGQLSDTQASLESVTAKLRQVELAERSSREAHETAERKLVELGSENRSRAGTAAALDAARAELDSLRRSQGRQLEEQEYRLRAEAQSTFERLSMDFQAREEAMNRTMMELRSHLAQVTDAAGWKEDQLRRELASARERSQLLERQSEEISASVPDATRPLLRQIQALQSLLAERNAAMESIEKSQFERIRESEQQAAQAKGKLDTAENRVTTLSVKMKTMEEQLKGAREERSQTSTELAEVTAKLAQCEEALKESKANGLNEQKQLADELSTLKKALEEEKRSKIEALSSADTREEELRQATRKLEGRVALLEHSLEEAKKQPEIIPPDSISKQLSTRTTDSVETDLLSQDGLLSQGRSMTALRLKTDEVKSLQDQLASKDSALQAVAEEVVKLTMELENARKEVSDAPALKKELGDMKQRLDTLMVLFGEKEERVQELEQDLADVNSMYKEQINDLLLQIEKMQRGR